LQNLYFFVNLYKYASLSAFTGIATGSFIMPKIRFLFALISITFLTQTTAFAIYQGGKPKRESYKPTSLIVKFKDDRAPQVITGKAGKTTIGLKSAADLNSNYNVKKVSPLLLKKSNNTKANNFGSVYLLETAEGTDIEALRDAYAQLPEVEYAEINQIVEFHELPDDSLYQYQWSLSNSGQLHYHVLRNYGNYNDELVMLNGIDDADIDVGEVYQNPPDRTVTVVAAIIDTGVDMDHPDLAANIWINPGEIPDNGIDDDHNGYIDDVNGWDYAATLDPLDPGDNDPTDSYGHGTHCSGIIAGVTNNNIGIAGIADNCRIMGLKFDPLPLTSRIAAAIIYAADNGADVVNMSFGFNYRSDLIEDAIEYAHNKGLVLCASSGNDGTYNLVYPAGYETTITVGSSNDSDQVSTFSTYGDHIDLVAPGQSILSLRADKMDMYAGSYPYEPQVHIVDSFYYMASGTSMSCPHVAGAAAVMRSVSPGLDPDRIKQILIESADDIIDPFGVGWNLPGYDQYSGYGRVSLAQALQLIPRIRAKIMSPGINEIISGEFDITGIADGDEFAGYTLSYGPGEIPEQWTEIFSSADSVTENILATWNTSGLSGRYSLRLDVGEFNVSQISLFIANDTQAVIAGPTGGQTIANFATIEGDAFAPGFSHAVMEYKSDTVGAVWELIDTFSVPVFRGILGGWFVEDLDEGNYDIRLMVYSYDTLLAADTVSVTVQSIFSTDRAWKAEVDGYPTIIPTYCDFDNDGINEILVGTSSSIMAFNPDGTVKTDGMPVFPRNNYMMPIAIGNLDDDGIDDIVAVGYDPPKVYCYRSSGGNSESYLGIFPPIGNFYRTENEFPKLMLKDIDGDGRDEIHVFIYSGSLSETFLFESNGELINSFDYFSESLPLDLDGDGIDELYAVNSGFGLIRQIDYNSGLTIDSLLIDMNGSNFKCTGMAGYDIDNDDRHELIIHGYYDDFGYWIYAFEDGLNLMEGWPHDMGIDDYVVPTEPIFADIDNDNEAEYLTTFFDITSSYVLAWNLDGSSFLPSSPNGSFAITPEPSVLNMLLLADMNGDDSPDIVACADNDIFNSYEPQRIYAWDTQARLLDGFPLIVSPEPYTSDRFTPAIGDIDSDGFIDMIITTPDSFQVFVNFPGVTFDACTSPVPFWRYSRKMNNTAPLPSECNSTDVAESEDRLIPELFYLSPNHPNPFNPSTTIEYSIPQRTHVTLSIYNILGEKIKTLVDRTLTAGNYSAVWDGKNESGRAAASGIYLYQIRTAEFSESRKMLLVK